MIPIEIVLSPGARMPERAHDGDAGWDLFATHDAIVWSHSTVLVSTGLFLAVPDGWFGMLLSRSSWAKAGHPAVSAVIDAGYRGELKVQIHNNTDAVFVVKPGDKIAQILFLPVPTVSWLVRDELPPSSRGENGFGSSG